MRDGNVTGCVEHVSRVSVQQSYTPYLLTSHALALVLANSHVCKEARTAELSIHTVYCGLQPPLKKKTDTLSQLVRHIALLSQSPWPYTLRAVL